MQSIGGRDIIYAAMRYMITAMAHSRQRDAFHLCPGGFLGNGFARIEVRGYCVQSVPTERVMITQSSRPSCRTCPVRHSRLLWSSTDPEAAHRRTVMRVASSRMYSTDKFGRRIPRLGHRGFIAPVRHSLSRPAALTWLVTQAAH